MVFSAENLMFSQKSTIFWPKLLPFIGVTSFAIRGHDFHVENFPAVSSNQCTDSNKRSMPTGLSGPITANYNRIYGANNNFSSVAAFFIDAFASASLKAANSVVKCSIYSVVSFLRHWISRTQKRTKRLERRQFLAYIANGQNRPSVDFRRNTFQEEPRSKWKKMAANNPKASPS
ncbi:hypothetical protein TNCV_2735401 [Trichonephila clavipes]|nr:hypothetical protein TNCV_2735401 [Trichonephila clavipes]